MAENDALDLSDPAVTQALDRYSALRRSRPAADIWMVHGHISPPGRYVTEAEAIAIALETFARWSIDENITHITCPFSACHVKAEFIQHCNISEDILQHDQFVLDAQGSPPTYASKEILGFRRISRARLVEAEVEAEPEAGVEVEVETEAEVDVTRMSKSPQRSLSDSALTLGELCLRPVSPRKVFAIHISCPFPGEPRPLLGWGDTYVFDDEVGALVVQIAPSILMGPDTSIEEVIIELEYSTPWGVVPTKEIMAVMGHNQKLEVVRITEDGMAVITQQKRMTTSWEDAPARLDELLHLAAADVPLVRMRHMGDSLRCLQFCLLDVPVGMAARL